MSTGEQEQAASAKATQSQQASLLDAAITATKQTERSRAEELLRTLTEEALKGTVSFDKDVTRTINAGIEAIDEIVTKQLAMIMHHEDFQKLEGTWRGLSYLVMNSNMSISSG